MASLAELGHIRTVLELLEHPVDADWLKAAWHLGVPSISHYSHMVLTARTSAFEIETKAMSKSDDARNACMY